MQQTQENQRLLIAPLLIAITLPTLSYQLSVLNPSPPTHIMPTNTAAASRIELPPPAWGSPAHQAKVRAEKEWVRHLRAHATQDADQRKVGKQTRYVEDIDVVIRYTLPPVWPEEALSKFVTDDDKWDLPEEDDALLIKILSAGYSPFYQRTGQFSKVCPFFSAIYGASARAIGCLSRFRTLC